MTEFIKDSGHHRCECLSDGHWLSSVSNSLFPDELSR